MESPVPDRDQASRFTGVRVLIIEDETLIALLLEDMLTDLGCTILGSASTVETAIDMLDRTPPSIAVLDINLGGEKSYAVAEALAKRGREQPDRRHRHKPGVFRKASEPTR